MNNYKPLLNEKLIRLIYVVMLLCASAGISGAQTINTIAGDGTCPDTGDGGPALLAAICAPIRLYFDASGNLFSGSGDIKVRKIDPFGIIHTAAGHGTTIGYSGDGGPATLAQLYVPEFVCMDASGNLYISDRANHRVRKVDASGIITTFAGTGVPGYTGDGGPATLAQIYNPTGIAVDVHGNVYFASSFTSVIRKVDPSGIISTAAGNGVLMFAGDGGPATAASFYDPEGIVFDHAGNLIISDQGNNRLRKIDTAGIITTIVGMSSAGYSGDGGPATAAKINKVWDITTDTFGNIYIPDCLNNRIRRINSAGIITTIAGTGIGGFSGDGGPASAARFYQPKGIARDCAGNLYISDNARIRKIQYNHPPHFAEGHSYSLTACSDTVTDISSILSVVDTDNAQAITWSVVMTAGHGSVAGSFTMLSTGGSLTPSGLTYTPVSGYTGYDSFKIAVSDCDKFPDTITVLVHVVPCPLSATSLTGDTMMRLWPNPSDGDFSLEMFAAIEQPVSVTVSDILGRVVQQYTGVTNTPMSLKLHAPQGIYVVSARTSSEQLMQKVLVH